MLQRARESRAGTNENEFRDAGGSSGLFFLVHSVEDPNSLDLQITAEINSFLHMQIIPLIWGSRLLE